jgi:hypothetical protein
MTRARGEEAHGPWVPHPCPRPVVNPWVMIHRPTARWCRPGSDYLGDDEPAGRELGAGGG